MHAPTINNRPSRVKFAAFFALFWLSLLPGCVHTGAAPPLLWSAEKDGRTHYLFGTVHVGVDAERDLPRSVWEAFSASPCLVVEADQRRSNARALIRLAALPPGQTLKAQLSAPAWERLQAQLSGRVPPDLLLRSAPWFAMISYLQATLPSGEPMDAAFMRRGTGKHRVYLESWREAMQAFARVATAAELETLVLDPASTEHQIDNLVSAYRSGDEARVVKAMDEVNGATPNGDAKVKILLDERNAAWMPRLTRALAEERCFVAVGAGHLVGNENLRVRLARLGYAIKRL